MLRKIISIQFILLILFIFPSISWSQAVSNPQPLEVEPTTGSSSFFFPIDVPPGRGGIQPGLAVSYNSGAQNGMLGMGWNLELGSIQRSTKRGAPKYNNEDSYVLIQNGGAQELVYDSVVGFYRSQIEGAFMKTEKSNDGWTVTDKRGVKYYFGSEPGAREYDPTDSSKVFKWCLNKVEDSLGNNMTVTYQRFDNTLYPQKIEYTGNSLQGNEAFAKVEFILEDRNDFTWTYKTGFSTKIKKRIQQIKVSAVGQTQGIYQMKYQYSPATDRSLLTQIVRVGADETTSLPPVTFEYEKGDKGFALTQGYLIPSGTAFTGSDEGKDYGVRIADVNADGYPDFIRSFDQDPTTKKVYLHNRDNGWVESSTWSAANVPDFIMDTDETYLPWGTAMVDINHDGWVDVVHSFMFDIPGVDGGLDMTILLNNKINGWVEDKSYYLTDGQYINQGNEKFFTRYSKYHGLVFTDFNNDGYTDMMCAQEFDHRTYIWSPSSNNWIEEQRWSTGGNIAANLVSAGLIVDLNGDGLPDIFMNDGREIAMNTGQGFVVDDNSPWADSFGIAQLADGSTQFVDVNGDNLPDLVKSKGTYAEGSHVLLNTGNGWKEDSDWLNGLNLRNNQSRFLDANGDGMIDVLYHIDGQTPELKLNKSKTPDLLVKMNNGIGGSTELTYMSSKSCSCTFFPFHIPVVASAVIKNGLGDVYTTSYHYEYGLWSVKDREFRGFAKVTITDVQGNYTESEYLQDDLLKGRVKEQRTYDAQGRLFSKVVNSYQSQDIAVGVNFVYQSRVDQFVYDGDGTGRRTAQEFFYEDSPQLGNVTRVVQYGQVDLSTGVDVDSDKQSSQTVYTKNITGDKWLHGLPVQTIGFDLNGKLIRQQWFYYDNLPLAAPPILGLLSKKENWISDDPGAAKPMEQYQYDSYGNIKKSIDAKGRATTTEYDPLCFMFPVKLKNSRDQEIKNSYYGIDDVKGTGYFGLWGQVQSTTDPNQQVGTMVYDQFGRKIKYVSPLDSLAMPSSSQEYQNFLNHMEVSAKSRVANGAPAVVETVSFSDGLGRVIQTKTPSAKAGQFIVSGQTEYNSRGLPERKYVPYFTNVALHEMTPIDRTQPHTLLEYDAMGRLVKSTNPDGTYSSVQYNDWTTVTIDDNGHKQESDFDAYGRLVVKREYTGADGRSPNYPSKSYDLYAATQYEYDSAGNLVKTIDAQGHIMTMAYDHLGRKIAMDDSDMGHWTYGYDEVGNLAWQLDAKGQRIDFSYDDLNRLEHKTGSGNLSTDYTYDDTAINYSKGRLTQAAYPQGDTQFVYDPLGREVKSIKKVGARNNQVDRGYNALDNLINVQYPNQEKAFYKYNAAGQIEGVANDQQLLTEAL